GSIVAAVRAAVRAPLPLHPAGPARLRRLASHAAGAALPADPARRRSRRSAADAGPARRAPRRVVDGRVHVAAVPPAVRFRAHPQLSAHRPVAVRPQYRGLVARPARFDPAGAARRLADADAQARTVSWPAVRATAEAAAPRAVGQA